MEHVIFISSFPFLFAFDVGGHDFEFCVFVAGWRHALRREWPCIIIIIIVVRVAKLRSGYGDSNYGVIRAFASCVRCWGHRF